MSELPAGWSIDVKETRIIFRVSGRPDDEFHLSTEEARGVEKQLWLAHLIAHRRELAETDPDSLATTTAPPEFFDDLLAALDVREAHRRSGLAAASDAWHGWRDFDEVGQGPEPDVPSYEIRDLRDSAERASIEAWLPVWQWPVVRAVHLGDSWLVWVGAEVRTTAGVPERDHYDLGAINSDEARAWVRLLASLYVKAAGR
ncbi:MAG: hypothetical protein K0U84_21595 [Actinomycetia bacterium]|nr:hypothetical protein [Actinomycetes bacterium]